MDDRRASAGDSPVPIILNGSEPDLDIDLPPIKVAMVRKVKVRMTRGATSRDRGTMRA